MKYLYMKDDMIFAECENCGRILKFRKYQVDEVKTGVECFCGNTSDTIQNLPQDAGISGGHAPQPGTDSTPQTNNAVAITRIEQPQNNTSSHKDLIPRCPTCGSTNIHKISLASKAIGGYMFGIYSRNIRNTFECYNCGYKW